MSFESHLRPWIDPEEPLEDYDGPETNEWIFDPEEESLEEYIANHYPNEGDQ